MTTAWYRHSISAKSAPTVIQAKLWIFWSSIKNWRALGDFRPVQKTTKPTICGVCMECQNKTEIWRSGRYQRSEISPESRKNVQSVRQDDGGRRRSIDDRFLRPAMYRSTISTSRKNVQNARNDRERRKAETRHSRPALAAADQSIQQFRERQKRSWTDEEEQRRVPCPSINILGTSSECIWSHWCRERLIMAERADNVRANTYLL